MMRGSDVHTISTNFPKVRRSVEKVLRSSKSVISVSDNLKSQSLKVFGKDYVNQILYTTCDFSLFNSQKVPSHRLTKWYFVGALYRPKGIFELLKAFHALILEGYDLELSMFGDGPHRAEFEEAIKANGLEGRITLFGQVSDRKRLLQLINQHDLLVFPSHNEGLPNSIVEAVAAGRGVISSRVGGVAEIAPQNTAYKLIEKKESSQIIGAFKQILNSPVEDFLSDLITNREKVVQRFSPASQQDAFRSIFKQSSN
jgi:glycosyltransferase involved in cell wall biosynthesis